MFILRYLGRVLTLLLAFVGALAVLGLVVGLVAWRYLPSFEPRVPRQAVLTIDLADGLVETRPESALAWAAASDALVLREVVQALDAAARDDRVKGVVARLGQGPLEMARAQELRDAILAFRRQGKFAVAFAETFGEAGPGNTHYYLATAFDEIWLQPSGEVGLVGQRLESPFAREALDGLGITAKLDQRKEYKGAMAVFTSDRMPEPVRTNLQRLVDSWVDQIAAGIAATRGIDKAAARALIDRGPFRAGDAKAEGLVDRLGYWDEVETTAFGRAGLGAKEIAIGDYIDALPAPPDDARRIAIVYGLGPVQLAESDGNPLLSQVTMGSEEVAGAVRDAVADDEVAAIVLRIDSPGGSYVAADTIWREVDRARQVGKPLVVSMGNLAASGGYFAAAPAYAIVAEPGTITGSIGVFGGKFVLAGFWDKLGINWDAVQAGANADIESANVDYSDAGWAYLQSSLDSIYRDFVKKVAAGRDLSPESVNEIAQGKVWSGADAKARGLVDELGGLSTAIAVARKAAGIAPDAPIRLERFPPEKGGYRALLRRILGAEFTRSGAADLLVPLARLAEAAAPIVRVFAPLAQTPESQRVRMPEMRTVP